MCAVTTLMIYDGAPAEDSAVSRTGGIPLVEEGFRWPVCAKCKGNMQFIAQLLPQDVPELHRALVIFMCQNDPGMCDDWNPTSGANKAFLFQTEGLRPAQAPAQGITRLGAVSALRMAQEAPPGAVVVGRVGGLPEWIQADETPGCRKCGDFMDFLAQFEQGAEHTTAMNFGGDGLGYAFTCKPCQQAAFGWQCS